MKTILNVLKAILRLIWLFSTFLIIPPAVYWLLTGEDWLDILDRINQIELEDLV